MLNGTRLLLWILLFLIMGVAQATAGVFLQQQDSGGRNYQAEESSVRRIKAVRTTQEIHVDGVLDEAAWSLASPAAAFRQEEPNEGEPATEKTEVRVLYDDKYFYVGIRAFDSEPER